VSFIPNPNIEREIKTDSGVREMLDDLGEQALDEAQSLAPVATGALRDSLAITRLDEGGVRLSVNVDYWLFPEFGTVNMPPEPYLRPTLTALGLRVTQ
jgi:HK97 gp10 family phage protein